MSSPLVTQLNDSAIRVVWKEPKKPNGLMKSYKLLVNDVQKATFKMPTVYTLANLQPYTSYDIKVSFKSSISIPFNFTCDNYGKIDQR